MFGPLVIAPLEVLENPTVEKPLARLSKEEMVKFIEEDLIFAASYLPTPAEAEYGRFSQGLANMLLIRLYLHESPDDKSYYTKVETIARELMSSSYGYRLSADYTKMFEIGGQGKSNTEIIWAIPRQHGSSKLGMTGTCSYCPPTLQTMVWQVDTNA